MELNPAEWTRAQELLLRLVDVLGPVANKQNPLTGAPRLFFPFSRSSLFGEGGPIRFGARLLTDLTDAKKEVEDWIGKLPSAPTESENDSPANEQKMGNLEKNVSESPALNTKEKFPSNLLKGLQNQPTVSREKISPVESKAQKLVEQVRSAILSLSSSSYLFDPKAGPLRDALKRLKPLIDQLIDAVSQEGMQLAGDGLPPPSRLKVAPSERETLLKRLVPFPTELQESRSSIQSRRPFSSSPSSPESIDPQTKKAGITTGIAKGEGVLPKPNGDSLLNPEKTAETEKPLHQDKGQERHADRTSIPAAPYISSTPSSSLSRKPKKKRKGFWLRDETSSDASPERDDAP